MRFRSGDGMAISDRFELEYPFTAFIVERYHGPARGYTLQGRDYRWDLGLSYLELLYNFKPPGFHVLSQRQLTTQGAPTVYVDGVSQHQYSDSRSNPGKIGLCRGGGFVNSRDNRDADADIACVLIWERTLSDEEYQTVEKWLSNKYGINTSHAVDLDAIARKYVAAVDFGVSREGKLAQVPDAITMPVMMAADPGGGASSADVNELTNLTSNIHNLESEHSRLTTEIANLKASLRPLDSTTERAIVFDEIYRKQKRTYQINKDLYTKRTRLAKLRRIRKGEVPPLPMALLHTDPRGLTVSSGLLGFAYTDSQPYLFESALGRMTIYFKGANKQFFSAYYDVNTARARWSLAVGSGSLTLVSRATDSLVNDTSIVVADGTDTDHCNVTLQNAKTGLTETWIDIPREASAFAQVLNGEAGEKSFVGKLKTSLSGAAITTIDLKDGLPREAPAGSTLLVEDSSSGSKQTSRLIIAAKAASGAKQITITSATPTLNADAKVYLLLYDYASKASSNRSGYTLDNGNLQVDVVVGSTTGKVGNATASRTTEAQSPQWTADAPGSALYFDGTDDYLPGTPHNNFEHEGDITLEAWARPLGSTGDSRLIHCKSGASHLALFVGTPADPC